MCISKTCFTLALCKLCHIEGRQQYVFFNHYIWSSPTFVTEKQRNTAWPYFWSLFTYLYASGPCIYHATSIWRSLHGANLKHVSEMHIFQNGTPCQSETCFRMAHFSERHAMPIWNMFQDGTFFRTARNTRKMTTGLHCDITANLKS